MDISQVWPEWHEDCVLGEGSFGKVYRAKRVEYGRTFYSAIKVLTVPKTQQEVKFARAQGMNDAEIYNYFHGLIESLLNEITLMENLKGAKNIVGIEDYKIIERQGEIGWDVFIRMELLTPFDSFISNPKFSQKDVIRLGLDICTALEVCEQSFIVHRDIKPDNIFVSRFGEYKLGDFGIARKLETTQANLSRKGTLNYMAPEIYKSEEYGSNVDIYSLGLVLYTLLNNNRIAFLPPYPEQITYRDNEEALSKRLSGEAMNPPCNASVSLGAVILKACAYRPQDRYQNATEFKNALISEWNQLLQSGNVQEIPSDAMRFGGNIAEQLKNTTNDMTANGRLVVDEFVQDTTVLNDEEILATPTEIPTTSSSKVCRYLAFPLGAVVGVLSVLLLLQNGTSIMDKIVAGSMLGIGISILFLGKVRYLMGVFLSVMSWGYIIEGLSVLIGGIQEGLPVLALTITLSGILLFCGGIVILTQKEVKLGGSMCLYSIVLEWLLYIYQMLNNRFQVEIWHIYFTIAVFAVFIWSYGYQSRK